MISVIEDSGNRQKLAALNDYSINLRTETYKLKLKNNLTELEQQMSADQDLNFLKECEAEMK